MPRFTLLLIISILLTFSAIAEAKKRCKPLLEKLQNIQAMQRHGYSAKRGVSLRNREDKARDKWWQCEKGRSKNNSKANKTVASKKNKPKVSSKGVNGKEIKAGTPFKTSNAIVIKSKYQGDKKYAWLTFYQQPTRCQRPKSLQTFAFCSEDKRTQRLDFEKSYADL